MLQCGSSRSNGNSVSRFLRHLQTDLQSECTSLHLHKQCISHTSRYRYIHEGFSVQGGIIKSLSLVDKDVRTFFFYIFYIFIFLFRMSELLKMFVSNLYFFFWLFSVRISAYFNLFIIQIYLYILHTYSSD